jgi:Signal transduction histidine kinase
MFKTLFSRMLASYLAAEILVLVLLGFVSGTISRNHYLSVTKENLIREADEINKIAIDEYISSEKRPIAREKIFAIVKQFDALLQLYFDDESIGKASFFDYQTSDKWRVSVETDFSEITKNASSEKSGEYTFYFDVLSDYIGSRTMTLSRAISDTGGKTYGRIVLHYNMDDIYGMLGELYNDIVFAAVLALIVIALITYLITRRITKPVTIMTNTVNAFSRGDYKKRIRLKQKDELGKLGESFNEMADKVAGLEKTRREFVANVSHELRSPLTSMRGFLEAMEDGVIPEEEYSKYINIVLDENKRMTGMVNDLLDIARIESGQSKLNRTVFDITELIGRVLITYESRINAKKVEVNALLPGASVYVDADEDRISQVLHNLIDNAIKFLPENGGRLGIQLIADKHAARVSVSDNGAAIPEDDLSRIFDRFYKAEKAHTYSSGSGTGLGLSIVKLIMDQHGEEISVSSDERETRFTFSLKRAQTPAKKN